MPNSDSAQSAAFDARLERIERSLVRGRTVVIVVVALAAGLLGSIGLSIVQGHEVLTTRTLVSQRIRVVDAAGRPRVLIDGGDEAGVGSILLLDASGHPHVRLVVSAPGEVVWTMLGKENRSQWSLSFERDGTSTLIRNGIEEIGSELEAAPPLNSRRDEGDQAIRRIANVQRLLAERARLEVDRRSAMDLVARLEQRVLDLQTRIEANSDALDGYGTDTNSPFYSEAGLEEYINEDRQLRSRLKAAQLDLSEHRRSAEKIEARFAAIERSLEAAGAAEVLEGSSR